MLPNRSMPGVAVIPELRYPDVPAAVQWLCRAFGFTVRWQAGDHRAQLAYEDGALIVAQGGPGDLESHEVMVRVADADAHHARAVAEGARVDGEPRDHPYGERQYGAVDLAGHRFTFSQSIADVAPEAWGGASGPALVDGDRPAGAVAPVPEHLHTVTARLVVRRGHDALDFYARAFGAQPLGEPFLGPEGELIHAEVRIGDSVVMVSEGEGYRALICTYWPDVDAAWDRALAAGAEVLYALGDKFYGERGGRLRDPFDQEWMVAARTEELTLEEINARAAREFG